MSFTFNFFDASEGKTAIELLLDEEEGCNNKQTAGEEEKKKKKAKKSKKKSVDTTAADPCSLPVSLASHADLKVAVAEEEKVAVKAVVEACEEKIFVVAAAVEATGSSDQVATDAAKVTTSTTATKTTMSKSVTKQAVVVEEKKKAKSKPKKSKPKSCNTTEADDESWYSPQQQNVIPAPPSKAATAKASKGKALPKEPHFVSAKDPRLDEQTQRKIKFGDGKNLVAIGPPKRRDPSWLTHSAKQQLETSEAAVLHSSPFAFGFL